VVVDGDQLDIVAKHQASDRSAGSVAPGTNHAG
jgi:hypothetical protein